MDNFFLRKFKKVIEYKKDSGGYFHKNKKHLRGNAIINFFIVFSEYETLFRKKIE